MTADTVGGVWTYALELSRALGRYGVHVDLASMGGAATPAQRSDAATIPNLTLHESTFRLEWMTEPWNDVQNAGAWLQALVEELQPDVIHFNNFVHASLPWPVPTLVVGHSCVYSWFAAVRGEHPDGAEWRRYRAEVAKGLRAADIVAAPTAAMLSELRRHYGITNPGRVVYNGRRAGDFRPLEKQPFVLAAGRVWDEAKNIATVAHLAPALDWEVRIAGEEQHPDGGVAAFSGVQVLGRLSQQALAIQYGNASIFCAPARYEPFGQCALEAALAGCALVLGDIPSLREVWSGAALYVDPDDESALVQAVNGLIRDEPARSALAARARRRALSFTIDRMADGYAALYASLLRARSVVPARTRLRTRQSTHT